MSFEVQLPYKIDFEWYNNADFEFVYFMLDAAAVPINNAGYKIAMEVRKGPDEPLLVAANTSNGRVILGGSNGKVTVRVSYALINPLEMGQYQHDLLEQPPGGLRTVVFIGVVTVKGGITESLP